MCFRRLFQIRSDVLSHTIHPCDSQDNSLARDGGDDGVPSMGRTIRSEGDTMSHTIPNILHNTMDRTIPSSRRSTKGHTIRDISMARNSMSTMENNVCSSTMSFRCCMDRTSIRSCSRDRISSRKDSLLQSPRYFPASGRI